jgi:hypothetical protein
MSWERTKTLYSLPPRAPRRSSGANRAMSCIDFEIDRLKPFPAGTSEVHSHPQAEKSSLQPFEGPYPKNNPFAQQTVHPHLLLQTVSVPEPHLAFAPPRTLFWPSPAVAR